MNAEVYKYQFRRLEKLENYYQNIFFNMNSSADESKKALENLQRIGTLKITHILSLRNIPIPEIVKL